MYRDPHRIKEIINAFKFKRLGKIKTEEPFIESKETTKERVKLEQQKREQESKSHIETNY